MIASSSASQAETFGEVRLPGRQHGGGSNGYAVHRVLILSWRFGDQGPGLAVARRPGPFFSCRTLTGALEPYVPCGRHRNPGPARVFREITNTESAPKTPLQRTRLDPDLWQGSGSQPHEQGTPALARGFCDYGT